MIDDGVLEFMASALDSSAFILFAPSRTDSGGPTSNAWDLEKGALLLLPHRY